MRGCGTGEGVAALFVGPVRERGIHRTRGVTLENADEEPVVRLPCAFVLDVAGEDFFARDVAMQERLWSATRLVPVNALERAEANLSRAPSIPLALYRDEGLVRSAHRTSCQ
jgi:hypothetical protein